MQRGNIRWFIVFLVFIATGLSFLDRQVLSIAIIRIQAEFGLSDVEYGWVNTAFLVSYAMMFTLGGRMMDVFGARPGMAVSVGLWSIANTLHGVMQNFQQMLSFRFLLGMGEGGCFPGAARTVYEWFPENQRAMANGIAIGGSALGAVIAPPLTIWISGALGWRWAFVLPGLTGVAWVIIWLLLPWKGKQTQSQARSTTSWRAILQKKEAWIFIVIRFMLDPVFYFLMFWIPKYLSDVRGVSYEQVGALFWIPFLALGISNIGGGWLSDRLIRPDGLPDRARKLVMGMAALLTTIAPFTAWASTVTTAIFLISVVMFAHGCWITNYITAIADIFGKSATSTVVGLSGTAGALAGLVLNPLIGLIVQHYTYTPLWVACGVMYPLAFLLFIWQIPKIRPLAL
jgi:ACS family hexuronate transporter-like MFS transporter